MPVAPSNLFLNIAAYRFVPLDRLEERRKELRTICRQLDLKGTVILSPEGINLFLAGNPDSVEEFLQSLRADPLLTHLEVKRSDSDHQPFERMLVKIKPEIIAFGVDGIDPLRRTSRRVSAVELRDWLAAGREITLLDVRNDYEVRVGTFSGAIPIGVDNFRQFPDAAAALPDELREKTIVTFCTGGIRCEKAGPYLEQAGFRDIYQLDGGILKYFEDVGGAHYEGECFVFDKRVALNPDLKETETKQCYACLTPLSVEDQQSPLYDPPHACPHCYKTPEQRARDLLDRREARVRELAEPLPGSVPYDNVRPLNVPLRFDRQTLYDFVRQAHPHLGDDHWRQACERGLIRQGGQPVPADRVVRAGEQFAHLHPATIEPEVNADIQLLFEDEALVVVNKPAPLPLHPCGRFHRNTLQWLLNAAYRPVKLRPGHRLDANTTGVVVFSKTRTFSAAVQKAFQEGSVSKRYLVRVQGEVPWKTEECTASISRESAACGGRTVCEDGHRSLTRFRRLSALNDGTSLLEAVPLTGRTNQIRIHLWHLGFPVSGDPLYLPGGVLGGTQTLESDRQMCLHAWEISLPHPQSGEMIRFVAPPPDWYPAADRQTFPGGN